MSISEFRKSSFVNRLITLLSITILLVFTALVAIENKELEKLLPPSKSRSLALLFGYTVAILSSNYLMAIRGRNFTNWKTELLISFNYVWLFSTILLPWLFPISVDIDTPWYKPFSDSTERVPNFWFLFMGMVQIPVAWITFKKVKSHFMQS